MKKRLSSEYAQVLPLFAMLTFVLMALMGLAVDIGKLYVARAQLARAVDSAALAGARELPNLTNADTEARAYIAGNDPDAAITVSVYPNVAAQQVGVKATKPVHTVFMKIFGIDTINVSNSATAGFGVTPVDTVLGIDATGSMGASPCNSNHNNSGCPIYEAKNAADNFVNTLLPSANTSVGALAFRGCFKPPASDSNCVPTSGSNNMIVDLSNDATTVQTDIGKIDAQGGTGTNVCGGLDKAAEILYGTGAHTAANTQRVIVLLSDGDNTYNNASYVSGTSPSSACTPSNPSSSDKYLSTGCSAAGQGSASSSNPGSSSESHERSLDTETKTRADALAAAGVEIYVVNFGVCGTDDGKHKSSSNYCSNIGNSDPDTVADQRLAKCIASSTTGTNDHYFRVDTASDLPAVFTQIAQTIAFRLVK